MHLVSFCNEFSILNGIKITLLHFFIMLERNEIPDASPILNCFKCNWEKAFYNRISDAEINCINKLMIIFLKHHTVFKKSNKLNCVELSFTVIKVISNLCTAQSRYCKHSLVHLAFVAVACKMCT